ncbi:Alpha/Beta hydrolase protein [Mycena albidolilacea]|uniref:Alpha/Beta hydrolase protein n=1 Tax=Mycena albidolilacea TaxID=1033008 RepID=A0AAD6Z820_9AGAR|nr:Alpha/Beta hydrolase protein [Mycena albidolilacea]
MAQYSHLSDPDPELPTIPRTAGPITAGMPKLELYKTRLPADSMYTLENHTISVEDGEICVRTVSPMPTADESSDFPVLVFFHGGGWVVGSIDSRDLDLRILSVELRLAIVNVGYRLAPEHPFPAGLNDCYTALKWTVENSHKIGGDVEKGFIVCGASAGANLAAAVTHRSLKDPFFKDRRITGNVLQIPVLVHPAAYPPQYASELLSYKQNKDAPILSKALMDVFYDCLAGPPADPELSPLLADHNGLPPTHLQICGLDPMRDEGLLYERLLREQGILTRLDIYPGVPHGFSSMLPEMMATKKWNADLREGLKWVLATV